MVLLIMVGTVFAVGPAGLIVTLCKNGGMSLSLIPIYRYFPILDADGKYCGMISRRNIINLRKRRIILVDHNEATQAVEGFDQAEILEIIDHHLSLIHI